MQETPPPPSDTAPQTVPDLPPPVPDAGLADISSAAVRGLDKNAELSAAAATPGTAAPGSTATAEASPVPGATPSKSAVRQKPVRGPGGKFMPADGKPRPPKSVPAATSPGAAPGADSVIVDSPPPPAAGVAGTAATPAAPAPPAPDDDGSGSFKGGGPPAVVGLFFLATGLSVISLCPGGCASTPGGQYVQTAEAYIATMQSLNAARQAGYIDAREWDTILMYRDVANRTLDMWRKALDGGKPVDTQFYLDAYNSAVGQLIAWRHKVETRHGPDPGSVSCPSSRTMPGGDASRPGRGQDRANPGTTRPDRQAAGTGQRSRRRLALWFPDGDCDGCAHPRKVAKIAT